jgi:phage baseplate assembly protein W
MAISRADAIGQLSKKPVTFTDFPNNFIKHPITNELVLLKNEDSVRQAFKNLILTNIGEKFFNPYFGSNVNKALFDNFGPWVVEDIRRYVLHAASQFEPRVTILDLQILNDNDRNGMSINIVFSVINTPDPINLSIFLKRVR